MLNVSDKAVSRWERSESYPDIELIPNIAKIFSISTDELISGELFDAKVEATKKSSLSLFRTMSLISIMLSLLGIIVAAIINIGLFRCYIAFFSSLVFYVASIFIEIIAMNNALSDLSDENKRKTISFGLKTISIPLFLIFFSLPLLGTGNSMVALMGASWLVQGALCLLIGVAVLSILSFIISKPLIDKGIYPLDDSEKETYLERRRLKGNISMLVVAIVVLSAIINIGILSTPYGGTKFYDYESFSEYMSRDEKRTSWTSYRSPANMVAVPTAEEIIEVTYYDRYGNEITEKEAKKREIRDKDGNTIYEYYHYNENVASVTYSPSSEGSLPITVRTYDDYYAKQERNSRVIFIFCVLYAFEVLSGLFAYFKLRKKN